MKFKQKSALDDHIKFKHSDERPFQCNFPGCKYGAKTSSNLICHMKVHSNDQPFVCPNEGCDFRTRLKGNLTTHLTTVHSTAKAFACSECDYQTTLRGNFKSHMQRRHSRRTDNSKYSHPECAENLICSNDLEVLLSNQDIDRSIHCEQSSCEQTFANNADALYDPE